MKRTQYYAEKQQQMFREAIEQMAKQLHDKAFQEAYASSTAFNGLDSKNIDMAAYYQTLEIQINKKAAQMTEQYLAENCQK